MRNTPLPSATLHEISTWNMEWNPKNPQSTSAPRVSLADIQREFVWKPHQIEGVWDSLIRHLPIGCFLLQPVREDNGQTSYQLLDGQQRCTAIQMAFHTAECWKENPQAWALWVDIAEPPQKLADRAFVFLVLTPTHPWGYSRDEANPLVSKERCTALEEYRQYFMTRSEEWRRDNKAWDYPGISPFHTWPWDAQAPVPFWLLREAVEDCKGKVEAVRTLLTDRISALWPTEDEFLCTKDSTLGCWKKRWSEEKYRERLEALIEHLHGILVESEHEEALHIPLIYVPQNNALMERLAPKPLSADDKTRIHKRMLETLFVRLNADGTRLEGEEMNYCLLKSALPQCREMVNSTAKDALMRPARLVSMAARLYWESNPQAGAIPKSLAPQPSTVDFRQKIFGVHKDKDFSERLCSFIETAPVQEESAAREHFVKITGELSDSCEGLGLGRFIVAGLAQEHPDIYNFYSTWRRYCGKAADSMELRRMLGVLTAVAWFAKDHKYVLNRLWENKGTWWHKETLLACIRGGIYNGNISLTMIPLPSPQLLYQHLLVMKNAFLYAKPLKQFIEMPFVQQMSQAGQESFECQAAVERAFNFCQQWLAPTDTDSKDIDSMNAIWGRFSWCFMKNRNNFLFYGQKDFFRNQWQNYDLSGTNNSDMDCPYEWDHILPESLWEIKYREECFDKCAWIWRDSVGNMRAWPMELNRGDGNATPITKLMRPDVLKDSAISGDVYTMWQKTGKEPQDENDERCVLKESLKERDHRADAALSAILQRTCDIYTKWYDDFLLKDTLGMENSGEIFSSCADK